MHYCIKVRILAYKRAVMLPQRLTATIMSRSSIKKKKNFNAGTAVSLRQMKVDHRPMITASLHPTKVDLGSKTKSRLPLRLRPKARPTQRLEQRWSGEKNY